MTRRETEARREKWRDARTAEFFAQYKEGGKGSVQETIKALSEWEAKRPESEI